MCILFAFVNPKPEPGGFKIILASNRDESFSRPALPAHEWLPKHSGVYGGQDMQPGKEGGTWLAMNKHGRISVLLNVGQSDSETITVADPTSGRGFYAVEWVTNMSESMEGIFNIVKEKHENRQQTFRLVVFDTNGEPKVGTLTYAGSKFDGFHEDYLPPGVHALGNNAPGITWNKIANGKKQFEAIVQQTNKWENRKELLCSLIDLLGNREKHWPDPGIVEQMKGSDPIMECLSAIFVDIPKFYGTRTQTVILINSENQTLFYERTMDGIPNDQPVTWIESHHEFLLESE